MDSAATCTLEGDELVDRINAWREVVSRATERRVEDSLAVASYPNDGELLEQLRGLIEAEASCCSFLQFTLEVRADRIVTELRLPEEMSLHEGDGPWSHAGMTEVPGVRHEQVQQPSPLSMVVNRQRRSKWWLLI